MSVPVPRYPFRDTAPHRALDCVELATELSAASASWDLFERVAEIRSAVAGRMVFTTSFGIEDQAITHAVLVQGLAIDIVTLDTGRLFPETLEVWAQTERCFGRRIPALAPRLDDLETLVRTQGVAGFRQSVEARQACCHVRKVEPLQRALAGAAAWVTGLRAEQSSNRAETAFAAVDPQRRLIKLNPLFDWRREQVVAFVRAHRIPYNALHDRGFLSIGCAPCTRAVGPDEPERAGRWWWEQEDKKECGLHRGHDHAVANTNPSGPRQAGRVL